MSGSVTSCARACVHCTASWLRLALRIANGDTCDAHHIFLSSAATAWLRELACRSSPSVVGLERCSALCVLRACTAVARGSGAVADLMAALALTAFDELVECIAVTLSGIAVDCATRWHYRMCGTDGGGASTSIISNDKRKWRACCCHSEGVARATQKSAVCDGQRCLAAAGADVGCQWSCGWTGAVRRACVRGGCECHRCA